MRKISVFCLILASIAARISVFSFAEAGEGELPPNFLVVLLDDAGWRDVGFAGNTYIETPNIDKLQSEGFDINFGGGNLVGAIKSYFAPYEGLPQNVPSEPGEYS